MTELDLWLTMGFRLVGLIGLLCAVWNLPWKRSMVILIRIILMRVEFYGVAF